VANPRTSLPPPRLCKPEVTGSIPVRSTSALAQRMQRMAPTRRTVSRLVGRRAAPRKNVAPRPAPLGQIGTPCRDFKTV
jgi:hypothetical protein